MWWIVAAVAVLWIGSGLVLAIRVVGPELKRSRLRVEEIDRAVKATEKKP
jgi:hypothetical protein